MSRCRVLNLELQFKLTMADTRGSKVMTVIVAAAFASSYFSNAAVNSLLSAVSGFAKVCCALDYNKYHNIPYMIRDFAYYDIRCPRVDHDGGPIVNVCMQPFCSQKSLCCSECMKFVHGQHFDFLESLQ